MDRFESRSALCGPDDVVPLRFSVTEEKDPFFVVDVGGSAPWRVISENFDIPLSSESLRHLFLDIDGVGIDIGSEVLDGLVDDVDGGGFLSIINSTSVSSQEMFWLGELVLLLNELFDGLVHGDCSSGSEEGADDCKGYEGLHKF